MAINRVPFNALIDDDGSNTVGTVWNKAAIQNVILDPVDAALYTTPVAFTPVDLSGGGLTFAAATGRYVQSGRFVGIWMYVTYPATSHGAPAIIGGLPFLNAADVLSGCYQAFGPPAVWHISYNNNFINVLNTPDMSSRTNAQMSGSTNVIVGMYLVKA